ncbi:MAG: hypothetical protein QG656_1743, partial [Candidatus Hydrogenedentes bacterium]|nr:hypothetical protein [Candidatus Hydrogenedentota bacterium]
MKRSTRMRIECVLAFLALFAASSYGAVTADPAQVTFASPGQSAIVKLTLDGAPVAAKDIRGWQFLASGHDYRHMVSVKTVDGAVTVAAGEMLEAGTYDLTIDTAHGPVSVQVLAPLSDVPDIVDRTAEQTGLSRKKAEEKLGLAFTVGRGEIQIELPALYYEGQTLELTMTPRPGSACSWFINGELVAEGPSLSYTFKEPDGYVVMYVETTQQEGKTVATARAEGYTRAVAVPPVPAKAVEWAETEFPPPAGYRKHVWRVNNEEVSTESTLKYRFPLPGTYTVECRASDPEQGP